MRFGFLKGKRVLLSGHTGFKGGWLAEILLGLGAEVIGYSLAPNTKPSLHALLNLTERTDEHIKDIRDLSQLETVFKKEKPEILFHLAAQPLVRESYEQPIETFSANVMGTANVLECIRKTQSVKAAVIVTTDKVYENKNIDVPYKETDELGGYDPYSSSKTCAEFVTRSYIRSYFNPLEGMPKTLIATARAGNVIGGGDWSKDRLVPDIIRAVIERDEEVVLRNPEAVRPWQHVLDPVFGYISLAEKLYQKDSSAVGAWNFAPDEQSFITTEELTKKTINALGKGSYTVKREKGKHEMKLLKLDASKAKASLGWKPRLGIDEGIAWTMEWYTAAYSNKNMEAITRKQIEKYMERM